MLFIVPNIVLLFVYFSRDVCDLCVSIVLLSLIILFWKFVALSYLTLRCVTWVTSREVVYRFSCCDRDIHLYSLQHLVCPYSDLFPSLFSYILSLEVIVKQSCLGILRQL